MYKEKYLKYKNKYLDLKNKIGGEYDPNDYIKYYKEKKIKGIPDNKLGYDTPNKFLL